MFVSNGHVTDLVILGLVWFRIIKIDSRLCIELMKYITVSMNYTLKKVKRTSFIYSVLRLWNVEKPFIGFMSLCTAIMWNVIEDIVTILHEWL